MIKDNEVYRIGRIGKPHGVKGELQVQIDDDVFDRVDADYLVLKIDGILVPFFMEEYRFKSDEVALIKFCDIDTQERARDLTGIEVYFPYALADEDDSEDVSTARIIGFRIVDANTGKTAGTIASVDDSTLNTLFELDNGILIPATDDMVEEINVQERVIRMDIPEGLLEVNSE